VCVRVCVCTRKIICVQAAAATAAAAAALARVCIMHIERLYYMRARARVLVSAFAHSPKRKA